MLRGQRVPDTLSAAAWRADLDSLAAAMHRRLPYAEEATGSDRFHALVDSLKRAVPTQTRDQRIVSVLRLANLPAAGTGHTSVRTAQRAIGWRTLPIYTYRFADGVYVMSAVDSTLIGAEVVSVAGAPVDSVYEALGASVGGDNRWDHQRRIEESTSSLRWVNHLKAIGLLDHTDEVPLRVRTSDGTVKRIRVETMQFDTPSFVRFATTGTYRPDVPEALHWSSAARQQSLREPNYRLSYRDSTDLVYLDFNAIQNQSEEFTVADLTDSLRQVIDTRPFDRLVIDLRTNSGGDSPLIEPVVDMLSTHPAFEERGSLYVLIGSETYSAAGLFAMELERRTTAIFAGEESGFAPNIWGENAVYQLPHSKISVHLSHHYHQAGLPESPRTHLQPDLHVPFTSDQHFQNVDSTMIAVRNHEPTPRETVDLSAEARSALTGTYLLSPVHRARIEPQEGAKEGTQVGTQNGALHLRVDTGTPEPFIVSDLHLLSEDRLATDVTGVYVERRPDGTLALDWKGTTYPLDPAAADHTLPLEDLRSGRFEQGADRLRRLKNQGVMLGNEQTISAVGDRMERPLPSWPDSLSDVELARRALPFEKLTVELTPTSWLAHFELAYVYQVLGRDDEMLEAAQKTADLSPVRGARILQRWVDVEVRDGTAILPDGDDEQ